MSSANFSKSKVGPKKKFALCEYFCVESGNARLHCHKECSTYVCWRSRMAKREREEEFEVSEVAPLQPLSR